MNLENQILKVISVRFFSRNAYENFLELVNDLKENKVETNLKDFVFQIYQQDLEMLAVIKDLIIYFSQKIIDSIEDKNNLQINNVKDVIIFSDIVDNETFDKYEDVEEIKEMKKGFKNVYTTLKILYLKYKYFKENLEIDQVVNFFTKNIENFLERISKMECNEC